MNNIKITMEFIDSEYTWKNMSLLEFINEGNIPSGWTEFFTDKDVQDQLRMISEELDKERPVINIYPQIHDVFRAFYMTPVDKIKAVILGQDPYHNGSAVGLCFSVKIGNVINPSLRNIYKELVDEGFKPNQDGNLSHWAKQGILLINSSLTVQSGEAESHLCHWDKFTGMLIRYIHKTRGDSIHWLLFGNPAIAIVLEHIPKTKNMHMTTHPSPLSASRSSKNACAFLGSGVFKKIPGIKW